MTLSVFNGSLSRTSENCLVSCLYLTSGMTSGSSVKCVQGNCNLIFKIDFALLLISAAEVKVYLCLRQGVILSRTSATVTTLQVVKAKYQAWKCIDINLGEVCTVTKCLGLVGNC